MKKKLLLISTLIATQLFSKTIDFEMIDSNPNRISPNSSNEILSFNSSIKNSVHSIVNISAKRHVNEGIENLPLQMFNDPFFKRFFGDQFGNQFKQNRIQRSLGSGVIISKDGYIVTNNHVIENAEEITVTIGDETTEYNAKLVGKIHFRCLAGALSRRRGYLYGHRQRPGLAQPALPLEKTRSLGLGRLSSQHPGLLG